LKRESVGTVETMASRKGRKRSQVAAARKGTAPRRGAGGSVRGPRSTWTRIGMAALVPSLALAIGLGVGLGRGGGGAGGGAAGGTGTKVIWGASSAGLAARLRAHHLPALSAEGTTLHIHAHLDVYVNGRHVLVPAAIGIGSTFISPVHTHDTTGVIHVESPTVETFRLGQFFDAWGVRLSSTCIGGYCDRGAARLYAHVDGKPYRGNPASIVLREHEEIALAYGAGAELPRPVPSTYHFAPGL
jgi:hypothetical protein